MNEGTFDRLTIGNPLGACLYMTAEGITLYEKRDLVRAMLWSGDSGTALTLHDNNGQERIKLLVDEHGAPEITVADGNEQRRVLVTMDNEGHPHVTLFDAMGTGRLEFKLLDGGSPSLALHDKSEKLRFHLLESDDEPEMIAFPPSGEERWRYILSQLAKKKA